MIILGNFWTYRISKVSIFRGKLLHYTFSIHEISFWYYRWGLKMVSKGENRFFRFFSISPHKWPPKPPLYSDFFPARKMTPKNAEKIPMFISRLWFTMVSVPSRKNKKVTIWNTLIYIDQPSQREETDKRPTDFCHWPNQRTNQRRPSSPDSPRVQTLTRDYLSCWMNEWMNESLSVTVNTTWFSMYSRVPNCRRGSFSDFPIFSHPIPLY